MAQSVILNAVRWHHLLLAGLLLASTACLSKVDVTGGQLYACGGQGDCLAGFTCSDTTDGKRCVPDEGSTPIEGFTVKQVSLGAVHSCAIDAGGILYCWGSNFGGQLGTGDTTLRTRPTPVGKAEDWQTVAAGGTHTCGIRADGSLWCWGGNQDGQVGNGTSGEQSNAHEPTQVRNQSTWRTVGAGSHHTCAIRTDNSLWCWGSNYSGQLGIDTSGVSTDKSAPTQVGKDTNWKSVSGGEFHTCGIRIDNTLWCWGSNAVGQLGLDLASLDPVTSPRQVGSKATWKSVVAGGEHTCGLQEDSTLWCWGNNLFGELGTGNSGGEHGKSAPEQIRKTDKWIALSAGGTHTCGVKEDNSMWCWGANDRGELGNGTSGESTFENLPHQVGTDLNWKSVFAGATHSCGVRSTGQIWCWGDSEEGQLGTGKSLIILTEPTKL